MPITSTRRAAIVALGSVSLFMTDDQRIVRVDVSRDLLARSDGPPPKSPNDYIARLQRYRRHFEQIAAAKYDEGQYEHEVKVLVVRITATDLIE
jgi:hypothetical protein